MQKKIAFFFVLNLCIAGLFFVSLDIDKKYPPVTTDDMLYLPSGKFLKGAALCYDDVLADLLWIKAIGYFGAHAQTDHNYTWLYHILDVTTTLDRRFFEPYDFGGIVLATEVGNVDQSMAILKKSMQEVPKTYERYWHLPFLLAFDYMFYRGDYLDAAHYLEIAAGFPQSPGYLPLLVVRLYANANDPEIAITFLNQIIKSTDSEQLKEKLATRIKEVIVDRDIRSLEAARDQFLAIWKRYPRDLNELVVAGLIRAIPHDPFGGRYYISPIDHSIHSTSMHGKLKLYIHREGPGPHIELEKR